MRAESATWAVKTSLCARRPVLHSLPSPTNFSCFSDRRRAFYPAASGDRRRPFTHHPEEIMKKLRLNLDALEVDSFQTSWLDNWEGTVHGEQVSGGGATQ